MRDREFIADTSALTLGRSENKNEGHIVLGKWTQGRHGPQRSMGNGKAHGVHTVRRGWGEQVSLGPVGNGYRV